MKKLIVYTMVSVLFSITVFTGCSNKNMSFATEEEMKAYIGDRMWVCTADNEVVEILHSSWGGMNQIYSFKRDIKEIFKESIININGFESDEVRFSDSLSKTLMATSGDIDGFEYEIESSLELDYKNGVLLSENKEELGAILKNGSFKFKDKTYELDKNNILANAYYKAQMELFEEKYGKLATNTDVQYDKHGNIGNKFVITGSAELDDYYNWSYENYSPLYFCIRTRPENGTFSDEWYMYAHRTDFKSLFNVLKGTLYGKLTLVGWCTEVNSNADNMAMVFDYFYIEDEYFAN